MISFDENFHHHYMQEALREAQKAAQAGEVPVGAVLVRENEIIARAFNLRESRQDATAHAEILALQRACEALGTWRLTGSSLYVTLEPCAMCAGAIVLARLDQVIIGTRDPKSGACGSVLNILEDSRLNHQPELIFGVMAKECSKILRDFFRAKR